MPTKGGQAIGLNYARMLAENFRKNKLGQTLLSDDTQAVWFSKETILTALGLDPSTDTKEITGIRAYMGAYGVRDGYPGNPSDYNKLTIVLVPTGQNEIPVIRGTVAETAFLDIIDDPTIQPSYPDSVPIVPEGKYYNEGQGFPPPSAGSVPGVGLMEW